MIASEVLKRLNDNSDFTVFVIYVLEEVAKIDTVSNLENLSFEEAGEEARVRSRTMLEIKKLLSPVINFVEKEKVDEERKKKKKHQYAL